MKQKILPTTEKRNQRSEKIDQLATEEMVQLINSEDMQIAPAVRKESRQMAAAIDMIVERMRKKGRLIYVGAGTSGRLGILDASECPPTFGTKPSLVQGIIAGGKSALVRAIEGAEDSQETGVKAIEQKKIKPVDVVVGIAACGMTPFVRGALKRARQLQAGTIFLTCAPENVKTITADIIINPVVGPEVITGSTRMKAGTATKLVLNTITTGVMIKLGKVYGNLMVDLKAVNQKLRDRSIRIIMELTGLTRPASRKLLARAEGKVKVAVVMHFRNVDLDKACQILEQNNQSLRCAIGE
jgi:N-acetylmuramic acid 6-phosphate etherase